MRYAKRTWLALCVNCADLMTLRLPSTCVPILLGKNQMVLIIFFRAKFGYDRVRNVVHCTDMPEDGALECQYFFSSLQKHQF